MSGKNSWGWWAVLLWAWMQVQAADAEPMQVRVELKNGNLYSGHLLPGSDNRLQLKPYWLERPLFVDPEDLKSFQQLNPQTDLSGEGKFRLHFPGGNALTVASLTLDSQGFVASPLWGGEIAVPVASLSRVEFLDTTGLLYHGPELLIPGTEQRGPQELRIPKPGMQWQTAPIQFPEKFQLEVEILPAARNFIYQISLFDWRRRSWGSVVFELTADQASAAWYLRVAPNRMQVKNWRKGLPEGGQERQQLRFYVNLPEKEITLMVNGEVVHTWQGELTASLQVVDPFAIGFRYLSGNGEMTIKSIRLYPWSGELSAEDPVQEKELLLLKTGEKYYGAVKELTEKELRFASGNPEETLSFPAEEIMAWVRSPQEKEDVSNLPHQTAKVFGAHGRESILMDVQSLEAGVLRGKVWTGAASFPLSMPLTAVQRIEFQEDPTP